MTRGICSWVLRDGVCLRGVTQSTLQNRSRWTERHSHAELHILPSPASRSPAPASLYRSPSWTHWWISSTQYHQYTASGPKSWSLQKIYSSKPFPHFFLWAQVEVCLQVVLWHTVCKVLSRNALSLNSKCRAMSPPFLNLSDDLEHTLLQMFPELQQLWGKRAVTPMSHQPLAAMKGTSMSGTNMSHYGPNATTMEILREWRAEKRQVKDVTLHSCHSASLQPNNFDIYSIISKHLRWFISVTSVFFCGKSDLKYCCTPYWQQFPHSPALNGGYRNNPEGHLPPMLLTQLAELPFFHLLCPSD